MHRNSGFTLTELMISLAIVAILLTLGVPSFRYLTNSYRISAEVNSLLGDLMYARAEAIKEGQNVTVCSTANGTTCSGAAAWQTGWLVYSNPLPGAASPPAGSVLRVQAAFTGTTPDSFVASSGIGSITYNREGFATTAAGFPSTTFVLHDPTINGTWTRCLLINPTGLLTTQNHVANAGTCT